MAMEKDKTTVSDIIHEWLPLIGAVALAVASMLGIVIIVCLVSLALV